MKTEWESRNLVSKYLDPLVLNNYVRHADVTDTVDTRNILKYIKLCIRVDYILKVDR